MHPSRGQTTSVRLTLDQFGIECLAPESGLTGVCTADFLRAAARHYLSQLTSGRVAVRVPRFARTATPAHQIEVELDLKCEELAALGAEAKRQDLSVECLLAHAALLYLSDVPSASPALAAVD